MKSEKKFDLEERTLDFAKDVRKLVKALPKSVALIEDGKQLVRSSGSVGANYIEANEALSKKDFMMRVKIARKEAKESRYWLKLIEVSEQFEKDRANLEQEAVELTKILSTILQKATV
ncbi:MAG: four helix bundle protein [Candidatus Paceibacterota bacterium]|jgi:four helix bundle protein